MMSEQFLAEIRMMSFNFPPRGWAQCNGQFLPLNQNQALFALLGTQYGGNGQTTFALPNLRGRVPIHMGGGHAIGEAGGVEAVTLNAQQMPQHSHQVNVSSAATGGTPVPANNFPGGANNAYLAPGPEGMTTMNPQTISTSGGSQAHPNMQPFLTVNFCIALQGIFPSRN